MGPPSLLIWNNTYKSADDSNTYIVGKRAIRNSKKNIQNIMEVRVCGCQIIICNPVNNKSSLQSKFNKVIFEFLEFCGWFE